jgi:hypothetical protein
MSTLCKDQANLLNTCTPDEVSIDNDIGTEGSYWAYRWIYID